MKQINIHHSARPQRDSHVTDEVGRETCFVWFENLHCLSANEGRSRAEMYKASPFLDSTITKRTKCVF